MKKSLFYLAAGLLFPLLFACQPKAQQDELKIDYDQYTLENGLKVVLHQDHSDPVVTLAIQFHVGSGREKPGKTGFAHFFEHMLFQRSENLPRNAFFQKIAAMGGDFNGGTGQDGTIYYETVPRDALEKVLWMESDRMGFFINTVTQAGLDREIDVILNEKRQTADNQAYGQAFAIESKEMYPAGHPYSWSVIGEMDDIRSATIEDVKEFYSTYYIPQNATLALAGDFDLEQAKALIQKYFGEVKKGNDIEKPKVWPAQLDQVKKVMYEDPFAPQPMLSLSYPTVEQYHADEQALNVLGWLMSGSKKSPLYKAIVEGNLAPSVGAYNGSQEVAGSFSISVQAFGGIALDTVYTAIENAMAQFEADGIDTKEMDMYKAMRETSSYSRLASVYGKATALARSTEYGGKPDRFIDDLEAIKAVTAEDVMRVYNQYIKGKNFLALSMVPKGQPQLALAGSRPADVQVENVEDASSQQTRSKAGAIVDDDYEKTPSAFDRSVEPDYLPNTPEITLPTIWSTTLANGAKLSGITQSEIPMVNFSIIIDGGMLLDPKGKIGVSYLNAALMNEGTALHTAEEIEQALSLLGARVRVSSSDVFTQISGSCLSRNLSSVLAIAQEIMLEPRFDEVVLEREKKKIEAAIQREEKSPTTIAYRTMSEVTFGKESFHAQSAHGTKESVEAITIDDIKAFHKTNLSPKVASIMVAGAIDQATCEAALQPLVSAWTGEEVAIERPDATTVGNEGKFFFVDYPGAKQSMILVGGKGKSYADPDYYALEVLNFKLGSGSNGLLFDVLRLQRGYTYGAYSGFSPDKDYGLFTASSSVQSTVTKESVGLFKEILSNFGPQFTEEMLQTSKNALLRSKAFSFETQGALLSMLNAIHFYDLPQDFVKAEENVIKNVSLEQIKALAEEYLNDKNLIYVVVGDAKTQLKNLPGAILLK